MKDEELQKWIFESGEDKNNLPEMPNKDKVLYAILSKALTETPQDTIPTNFSSKVVAHLQQKESIKQGVLRAITTVLLSISLVIMAFGSLYLLKFNTMVQQFITMVKDNYVLMGVIVLILGIMHIIDKVVLIRRFKIFPF